MFVNDIEQNEYYNQQNYAENNYGYYWGAETVKSRLKEKMVTAFSKIWEKYDGSKHDFRTNTYLLAIDKILVAEKLRGRL